MTASPGARPLERRRHVEPAASREKGEDILLPAGFVEVDRKEVTRFIQQQRIHTRDERLADGVLAPQMPADHVVGHRQQATLEAVRALDPWLLAQAPHPLVGTGRLVACPACSPALESARVHVFPTAEERSEERDLLVGRRSPRDGQGYRSARHEGQSSRDQAPRNAPRTRRPAGADLGLWNACSAERACCAGAIFGENAETGRFLKTVSSPTPAASTILCFRYLLEDPLIPLECPSRRGVDTGAGTRLGSRTWCMTQPSTRSVVSPFFARGPRR